ncbi:uncharacterized protein EDB91DRAFT_1247537 [Suillus paluster]|uniref:uncharacterized protein n=1 Tax=Suillus paluster TaxID=48578 RepID=UPI001B8634FF|nr:uncharacterized protein EDB91DRAFT_1247537 [Suillus paluster]KAG1742729.1 hypothetical protein EDB91DRAFT_1247537 [Suillus paluster]
MAAWQNPFSFSRTRRGAWRRLDSEKHFDSEKCPDSKGRYCAIRNLCDGLLACHVFIQVAIFIIALWFAIYVRTRGPISLPSGVAEAAINNPRIAYYVVTLVATVMSFLNTALLSRVLQKALIARMSRPLSLQTLRGSLSLMTRQTLLGVRGLKIFWALIKSLACMSNGENIGPSDRLYWRWLKYTLMYAILCGPLTPSWVSFLTPTPVDLQFDFTGTQMDYSAAAAQLQASWNGYVAPYPSESSPLVTYMNATRGLQGYGLQKVSQYTQAGTAAVVTKFGSPYYIPLPDALYNGSTADTIDILAMVDLNDSALGDGVLIGSICKYQDFEKATNQSFLVLMQGFDPSYSFITPTICEVSPRITSVKIDFDGTTVNINETTNYEPLDPEGQQAVFIDQISDLIWLMTFDTQSISGNSMAAGIQMATYAYDGFPIPDSALLNFTLENYLRGAIELLGTASFHFCRSTVDYMFDYQSWQLNLQQMSNTTMMQYTGIVHVQSMGYEYKRTTYLFLLVPLAVVVILTCAAAVYKPAAEPKKPGDVSLDFSESIDKAMDRPCNVLCRLGEL